MYSHINGGHGTSARSGIQRALCSQIVATRELQFQWPLLCGPTLNRFFPKPNRKQLRWEWCQSGTNRPSHPSCFRFAATEEGTQSATTFHHRHTKNVTYIKEWAFKTQEVWPCLRCEKLGTEGAAICKASVEDCAGGRQSQRHEHVPPRHHGRHHLSIGS